MTFLKSWYLDNEYSTYTDILLCFVFVFVAVVEYDYGKYFAQ